MPKLDPSKRESQGRLENKVAIVTGAAGGLGRAIAEVYAEEGAAVVVTDRLKVEGERAAAAIRSAGGTALFSHADLRESEAIVALVAAAEAEFGKLDIMTANAATQNPGTPEAAHGFSSDSDLEEILDVNFVGVWRCFKHSLPAILRAGGGAMTATASIGALRGVAGAASYAASKGAIISMIRALVAGLDDSVRINVVAPGVMATDRTGVAPFPQPWDWTRRADPREVANCHLFLVSSEASFVNGHVLIADGGQSGLLHDWYGCHGMTGPGLSLPATR
jgi:NAD(P)-dependent dehydrogenase (short-subunit alcohol dehydrogenase family)